MAKQLDPKVAEVLKGYGFNADACWNCHGTWVVYHKVLEQIAAQAGVKYREPSILVAEKDAAAILVHGDLGDKSEWSIGEAVVGLNYKVAGNQAGYPFAMAEKRAKDRVILKLIGLHGLAYSEEEADDFAPPAEPQQQGRTTAETYTAACLQIIRNTNSPEALVEWWNEEKPNRVKWKVSQPQIDEMRDAIGIRRDELTNPVKEAAE